jgi:hypothetical protein
MLSKFAYCLIAKFEFIIWTLFYAIVVTFCVKVNGDLCRMSVRRSKIMMLLLLLFDLIKNMNYFQAGSIKSSWAIQKNCKNYSMKRHTKRWSPKRLNTNYSFKYRSRLKNQIDMI